MLKQRPKMCLHMKEKILPTYFTHQKSTKKGVIIEADNLTKLYNYWNICVQMFVY